MSTSWYYMCIKKKNKIKKERREKMNSANIMKNMKTLKKKKNQVKIQWLHIVSKNGNNS